MKTLRPGQIAAYCDVHHRTVSRWIAQGQLKGHKLPGRGNYRVLLDDFVAFLQQQKMPMPLALFDAALHQSGMPHATMSARVLVIATDLTCRDLIRRQLLAFGYQLDFAKDGFQAGTKLHTTRPDLVVLDWSVSGVDGADVLHYIRQQTEFATTRILVLSDAAHQAEQTAAADAVLLKPVDKDLLLKQVQHLLKSPALAD